MARVQTRAGPKSLLVYCDPESYSTYSPVPLALLIFLPLALLLCEPALSFERKRQNCYAPLDRKSPREDWHRKQDERTKECLASGGHGWPHPPNHCGRDYGC